MQERLSALGALAGARWPGSELVARRDEVGGSTNRRMHVELEGAIVADSGWCDGSEAALVALEEAVGSEPQQDPRPSGRRPKRRRS